MWFIFFGWVGVIKCVCDMGTQCIHMNTIKGKLYIFSKCFRRFVLISIFLFTNIHFALMKFLKFKGLLWSQSSVNISLKEVHGNWGLENFFSSSMFSAYKMYYENNWNEWLMEEFWMHEFFNIETKWKEIFC